MAGTARHSGIIKSCNSALSVDKGPCASPWVCGAGGGAREARARLQVSYFVIRTVALAEIHLRFPPIHLRFLS
jgi:hypothetical protein